MNAEPVGIAAGQESRARRRADRLGDMEIAKDSTLAGEAIEVRSLKAFGAENPDVGITLIIGEDDDDVGQGGSSSGKSRCQTQEQNAKRGQNGFSERTIERLHQCKQMAWDADFVQAEVANWVMASTSKPELSHNSYDSAVFHLQQTETVSCL